jgi:hypothetical protein
MDAVQYCMLLLEDENREVLQCLLFFLHDISLSSQTNKMDARNIAICLAPTLLNMNNIKDINTGGSGSNNNSVQLSILPVAFSSLNPNTSSSSTSTAAALYSGQSLYSRQCNASLDCLTWMIEQCKRLFQIPNEAYAKCQFSKSDYSLSLTLNELLGSFSHSMLNLYINDRIEEMLKVNIYF